MHISVDTDFDVDADGALDTLMVRIREHIQSTLPPLEPAPVQAAPPSAPLSGPVVRSLSLVTQHVQEMRTLLTLLEDWMRNETERSAYLGQETSVRLDRIETMLHATVSRVDALAARVPSPEEEAQVEQAAMRPRDVTAEETKSPAGLRHGSETGMTAGSVWSFLTRLRQRRR